MGVEASFVRHIIGVVIPGADDRFYPAIFSAPGKFFPVVPPVRGDAGAFFSVIWPFLRALGFIVGEFPILAAVGTTSGSLVSTMKIMLGNNVRLPLTAEPWVEADIPVEFSVMPVQTISLTRPPSPNGLASTKVASPPPRPVAEQAFHEPFDQFDDLFTPLGSTALSDWPL